MKPLVLWCRWHDARLRLHGRSPEEVWGELAFADGTTPFRYHLSAQALTLDEDGTTTTLHLDEQGVEVEEP